MLDRTRWRVLEEPCSPELAAARWRAARERGAVGAVTSWGSGMQGRPLIRLYWEQDGGEVPEGEDLIEENWTPYWRTSFHATAVTRDIHLIPAWEEVPSGPRHALRIDPGMAFGAGDHPTTRLCLQLLEDLAADGGLSARFLDVGTGTGVLCLAAASLGCRHAVGLDIDPFGYAACRRNAQLNGLQQRVRPQLHSLDLVAECFPLMAANIVAGQLSTLAEHLSRRLEPGGTLLLSGFEVGAAAGVVQRVGLPLVEQREEQGWVAVALRKPVLGEGGADAG